MNEISRPLGSFCAVCPLSAPLHTAMLVARAVVRFAETGEGDLHWDPPHHILAAGVHDVILTINEDAQVVAVLHIYRVRR